MANPSLQPRVDDYDSDDSDNQDGPVLESFRRSPAANVAAKRSHPSDLGNEKSPAVEMVVPIDHQSDSGYSSHYTTGTMSSADSALSSPPSAPASAASQPPTSPVIIKRRPTISDDRKNSSQGSPRRQPTRSGSVSTRKPKERKQTIERENCTDLNCTKCGPNALPSSQRGRRPEPLQRDSALDVSYRPPPFDQRSQRSDPAPSYVSYPQSPTSTRPSPYSLQGSAIVQPAHSTRRRSSSTNRPIRPVSFHGGDPGNYYVSSLQSAPYITSQEHRGPPPSMSAHFMHHPPQMAPYMPQPHPTNYYGSPLGHPMQTQSLYDAQVQRPAMPSRTSSNNYHTRRPVSAYGPAVVTQDQSTEVMPSARYASNAQNGRQVSPSESESDSSGYGYSDEEEEVPVRTTRNRALMGPPPPPAPKSSAQRRPSLRHAATTQVCNVDRRMSQSQTLPERPRERDSRDSRDSRPSRVTNASSRAPSASRPALIQHPKAQSPFESTRNAQVFVETSKPSRRQSTQIYDAPFAAEEKERRRANRNSRVFAEDVNRNPKIYADDGKRSSNMYAVESKRSSKTYAETSNRNSRVYEDDAIVPTRRRQTESDVRRREEQILEQRSMRAAQDDVEAYMRNTRGSNDPLIDKVHKAAKRASRVPSGPSEAESSRSKGSASNRTTVTNGGTGDIRIRVDASAPLSLQFNGDMDGRTLHIEPTEDGMADIVIGNPGSRPENVYRSERGSIMGGIKAPKAIMSSQARREAEESSVKSERSSQANRRESERRVLERRRRDRELEYEYS